MSRCLLAAAAGLALASVSARAQRPVITENTDEPGRVPYFETGRFGPGNIQYRLSVPPANVRRVITKVTCRFSSAVNSALDVTLSDLTVGGPRFDVSAQAAFSDSRSYFFGFTQDVLFYVGPSVSTYMTVFSPGISDAIGTCTVFGYAVVIS